MARLSFSMIWCFGPHRFSPQTVTLLQKCDKECSVTYGLAFPCHYFRSLMSPVFIGSLKSITVGLKVSLPQTCQTLFKQLALPPSAPTELFCFLVPFQVPCDLHSCSPPASPTHPYRAQRATMRPHDAVPALTPPVPLPVPGPLYFCLY